MAKVKEIERGVWDNLNPCHIGAAVAVIDPKRPVIPLVVVTKTDQVLLAAKHHTGKAVVIIWNLNYGNHEPPPKYPTTLSIPFFSASSLPIIMLPIL